MPRKLFTPLEANESLPLVRRIVDDILDTGRKLREINDQGKDVRQEPAGLALLREMDEFFAELDAIGCSYRDWNFDMGLVDFPGMIDGEEVMLCWRSDESELRFYHTVNGGYAARRPIPQQYLPPESKAALVSGQEA